MKDLSSLDSVCPGAIQHCRQRKENGANNHLRGTQETLLDYDKQCIRFFSLLVFNVL